MLENITPALERATNLNILNSHIKLLPIEFSFNYSLSFIYILTIQFYQPWLERCVCREKGEKTFLIAKISEKKNLVVVLDFVAAANLKFPNYIPRRRNVYIPINDQNNATLYS